MCICVLLGFFMYFVRNLKESFFFVDKHVLNTLLLKLRWSTLGKSCATNDPFNGAKNSDDSISLHR